MQRGGIGKLVAHFTQQKVYTLLTFTGQLTNELKQASRIHHLNINEKHEWTQVSFFFFS